MNLPAKQGDDTHYTSAEWREGKVTLPQEYKHLGMDPLPRWLFQSSRWIAIIGLCYATLTFSGTLMDKALIFVFVILAGLELLKLLPEPSKAANETARQRFLEGIEYDESDPTQTLCSISFDYCGWRYGNDVGVLQFLDGFVIFRGSRTEFALSAKSMADALSPEWRDRTLPLNVQLQRSLSVLYQVIPLSYNPRYQVRVRSLANTEKKPWWKGSDSVFSDQQKPDPERTVCLPPLHPGDWYLQERKKLSFASYFAATWLTLLAFATQIWPILFPSIPIAAYTAWRNKDLQALRAASSMPAAID